jgi:hypothetical protein
MRTVAPPCRRSRLLWIDDEVSADDACVRAQFEFLYAFAATGHDINPDAGEPYDRNIPSQWSGAVSHSAHEERAEAGLPSGGGVPIELKAENGVTTFSLDRPMWHPMATMVVVEYEGTQVENSGREHSRFVRARLGVFIRRRVDSPVGAPNDAEQRELRVARRRFVERPPPSLHHLTEPRKGATPFRRYAGFPQAKQPEAKPQLAPRIRHLDAHARRPRRVSAFDRSAPARIQRRRFVLNRPICCPARPPDWPVCPLLT